LSQPPLALLPVFRQRYASVSLAATQPKGYAGQLGCELEETTTIGLDRYCREA
jgi:hypothetical protein